MTSLFQRFKGRLNSTKRTILRLFNTLYELRHKSDGSIVITSWIEYKFGRLKHRNWGDELNVYLIELLTKKKVINRDDVMLPSSLNYCVIGSIADTDSNSKTIIWGAGALYGEDYTMKKFPFKICAVRGKLTREYFLSKGIYCPPIYGDPALLLPWVYTPKSNNIRYKLGIIPHHCDLNNKLILDLVKKHKNYAILINLKDYHDWRYIIDQINSCDLILSSSLHGLIVSDAYKIPNIWMKPSFEFEGGFFKFYDYFSGVGKKHLNPMILTESTDLDDIMNLGKYYTPIDFNPYPLLYACPFPIDLSFFSRHSL